MNKNNNIASRLKKYSVTPPLRIWEKLQQELFEPEEEVLLKSSLSRLGQLESTPPAELYIQIKTSLEEEKNKFHLLSLQEFEMPPPIEAFRNILKKTKKPAGLVKNRTIILTFLHKYRAVAAIFMGGAIGSLIITQIIATYKQSATTKQGNEIFPPHYKDLDNAGPLTGTKNSTEVTHKYPLQQKKQTAEKNDNYLMVSSVSVNGYPISVTNNDLLFTFAGLRYAEAAPLFKNEEEKNLTITVDQYTNIAISKSMRKTFSELYKITRSGKPTRKAKKAKTRIEKWKKTDAAIFDKHVKNNPFDVIDLSDFIFKN